MLTLNLKNFRSFENTGAISIKPLTIFVGKNGSGKSSVTRFLPLLRQSSEVRASAPLVWFGDYVDFGAISDVSCKLTNQKDIEIGVSLHGSQINQRRDKNLKGNPPYYSRSRVTFDYMENISYHALIPDDKENTRIRKFSLLFDRDKIKIEIDESNRVRSAKFNAVDIMDYINTDELSVAPSSFVPTLIARIKAKNSRYRIDTIPSIQSALKQKYKEYLHKNTNQETINRIVRIIDYMPAPEFSEQIRSFRFGVKSWDNIISLANSDQKTPELEELRALHCFSQLPAIINEINDAFLDKFRSITYLGPARATGERFYRNQELAVDQIDPKGSNLAMFVSSLTPTESKLFSDWLESILEYQIKAQKTSGHVSLMLKQSGSDKWFNIADMGYGFSQVLPILAEIWIQSFNRRRPASRSRIVAIEQPELHLHPSFQGAMADAFARAIYRKRDEERVLSGINMVIETHSEALIARVGDLILEGYVRSKDVCVYIFDRDDEESPTDIRSVTFDKKGRLRNWPIGFFSRS